MSFDLVYNGITGILKAQGLDESTQTIDFKDAPVNEYGNTFVIKCVSGEQPLETCINKFYDQQKWTIQVAYAKNDATAVVVSGEVNRRKDTLITKLDDPASWTGFVRMMKYSSWEITEHPNYFVLAITLAVQDTYTY